MQHENISSFAYSAETQTHGYALVVPRQATWRQLLPAHRLPVIAKSPFMVALGVYISGGRFDNPAVGLTMLLAGALWAVLYALNETTDLRREHHLVVPRFTQWALFAACGLVCLAAAWLSPVLGEICAVMAAGQMAYCVPPVRLKRYWWAGLILSGVLNPILRLECGAIWGAHAIPPLAYMVFITLHLGASIKSRVLLRDRDSRLSYHVAPPRTEWVGMACTGIGFVGAYGLCWQGLFPHIFYGFVTVAAVFSLYAWSGHGTSVARLRQGWLWFVVLALFAVAMLYFNRV